MRPPVIHADGTVTCWRIDLGNYDRVVPESITAEMFALMRPSDRRRLAGYFPVLRALTTERSLVRVRIDFVMALPLGSILPSPQMEAVDSAALAIAGPVEIMPRSKISVGFYRPPPPAVPLSRSRTRAGERRKRRP